MKKKYKFLVVVTTVLMMLSVVVTQCAAYTYTGESGTYYVPDEFFGDVTRWDSSFNFSSGYHDFLYNTDPEQWATASYQGASGVTLTNNFIDNYAKFEQAQTEFAGITDFSVGQPKFGFQIPLSDPYSVVFEFDVSCYGAEIPNFQLVANNRIIYDSSMHDLYSWSKAVTTLDIYDPDQDTIVPVEMSIFSIHFVVTVSSDGSVSTVATTPHSDNTSTVTNSFTPNGYGTLNFGLQLVGESYLWSYFGIGDTDAWSRGFPGMGIGLVPDISQYSSLDKYRKVKIVSLEISEDDKEAFFDSVVDDIVAGETAELKEKAADYDTLYQQYQSLDLQLYTATQRIASLEAEIDELETERDGYLYDLTEIYDYINANYGGSPFSSDAISTIQYLEAEIDRCVSLIQEKNAEIETLIAERDTLKNERDTLALQVHNLERDVANWETLYRFKCEQAYAYEGADAMDNLFTGITGGLIDMLNGVSELRFGEDGVTVGTLITITVIGVVAFFVIKLVRGN